MDRNSKEDKAKIAKVILTILAGAGVLSMAVLAPNALSSLNMFYEKRKKKYNPKYNVEKTVTKLKKQGLIKFQDENGRTFVRLTENGREKLLRYQLREAVIQKPKKWDKKWRVIIFDIREDRRTKRNAFRKELSNLGFIRLQNSVWAYPYECEDIIIMLKSHFRFGKDVLYITADRIENDKPLKQIFGLI